MDKTKEGGFSFGFAFITWFVGELARLIATGSTERLGKGGFIILMFSIGSGYIYHWVKEKIKIENLTVKITLAFLCTEIIAFIGVLLLMSIFY